MREWFSSAELMALDEMPNSVSGISRRAQRENWKSRKAKGGGRSLEYHISNFDTRLQEELHARSIGLGMQSMKIVNPTLGTTHPPKNIEHITTNYDELIDELVDAGKYDELKKHVHSLFQQSIAKIHGSLDTVELDFFDVDVSAGHGALVIQEDQRDCITFSRKFIDNEIGVNSKNVFLMPVKGDSMAPTLRNQALIMVNRIEKFSGDGVYVFRFDGQLMVKRLQFSKNGLTVVSDNSTYREWELTRQELETEDFEIIGEVVWSGQRM